MDTEEYLNLLYKSTMGYLEGKVNIEYLEKIINYLLKFIDKLDYNFGKGVEASSYKFSAGELLKYLKENNNEMKINSQDNDKEKSEKKLRLYAYIADMFNNIKSALNLAEFYSGGNNRKACYNCSCGIKKKMVQLMEVECKKLGISDYCGFTQPNERGLVSFAIDIPTIGQVCWHFPAKNINHTHEYKYAIENKITSFTNQSLLCNKLNETDVIPPRIKAVREARNVDEMKENLRNLESKSTIPGLGDMVKPDADAALGVANIDEQNDNIISKVAPNKDNDAPGEGEDDDTPGPGEG